MAQHALCEVLTGLPCLSLVSAGQGVVWSTDLAETCTCTQARTCAQMAADLPFTLSVPASDDTDAMTAHVLQANSCCFGHTDTCNVF